MVRRLRGKWRLPVCIYLRAASNQCKIVHHIPERLLHTALNPPAPAPSFPAPPSKAITATDGQVTQRGQAGEGLKQDLNSREGSGSKSSRGIEGVRVRPREQMLVRVDTPAATGPTSASSSATAGTVECPYCWAATCAASV